MFRTEIEITPSSEKINHSTKILTIGSCFSQVIGERLARNKFNTLVNPFGTVFNPISIFKLIEVSLSENNSLLDGAIENKGVWLNHYFHSEFYGLSREELNIKIQKKIDEVKQFLSEVDTIVITLGTAFVYRQKSSNEIVSNCHKVPATNFTKELLTAEMIIEIFAHLFNKLITNNPKLKIILTVSPVRHTKDSLQLNSVSKSILRLACHELSERFTVVDYFPAYEIMMDDLRDYRFYKEDMIHPTEVAEDYIWDKFSDVYFEDSTKAIIGEWSSVLKAMQHRPFREESEEYKNFLYVTLKKLEALQGKIDVREEISILRSKFL